MNRNYKKVLWLILALTTIIGTGHTSSGATYFTDVKGHWAESDIYEGVALGIVSGYSDNTFKPNSLVTRAEFSKMMNQALGVTHTTSINMWDVSYYHWYYYEVQKAVAAGYISGYTDGSFKPNHRISRQEAATMIAKIMPRETLSVGQKVYVDYNQVASWARDHVDLVASKGYITGDANGMYRPGGALTRAEACVILVRVLKGEQIVRNTTYINSDNLSRSRQIYANNLIIEENVGSGHVKLDNIVVLGELIVEGGGENTIDINNSRIMKLTMAKDTGDVRVVLRGGTGVEDLLIKNGGILEQRDVLGNDVKQVRLKGRALDEQRVTLLGNFPNVKIEEEAMMTLGSGSIQYLMVASEGKDSILRLSYGTRVEISAVYAPTHFKGAGTLTTLRAYANDITYETLPSQVTRGTSLRRPPALAEDEQGPEPTFYPGDGARDIAVSSQIVVVFDEPIYRDYGEPITSSDIRNIIDIRRTRTTGTRIDYEATISSDQRTLTLTPIDYLETDTYYYIVLRDESVMDIYGNENDRMTARFRTSGLDLVPPEPDFSPREGATGVSVNTSIVIDFDRSVLMIGDRDIEDGQIPTFIELRAGSVTGPKKVFRAEMRSGDESIRIYPTGSLDLNETYYIIVLANYIMDESGNVIPRTTSYFKTVLPTASRPVISTNPSDTTQVMNHGIVRVTLTTGTSGGYIYYTLDGSNPTTSDLIYTAPFELSTDLLLGETITVKAVTVHSDMNTSSTATKVINFLPNQVAAPLITSDAVNPDAIEQGTNVNITITTTTPGTSIYFTTNGNDPTEQDTEYTGAFSINAPVNLDGTITIKAIAVGEGMDDSEMVNLTLIFIND
ncbi:S-layer homology domain-containing protein [Petrocella sp. FN5]|uniref:S-layer homology domain-containing protein n=1 Tax=Petrocella sp. FN5 TaxID=3032002 RepID=UPI0023DB9076|nr:S-layer homology domain-containing protein [Petrocella sp. FN5]MDF1617944.1 S-layer homology domain-containing protein [Petrocella sp. FN5]